MDVAFSFLLLFSFFPVFFPFGHKKVENLGLLFLSSTYFLYLTCFLFFLYFLLFKDLYFGYGLLDQFFYLIFGLVMIIGNIGLGLRNKTEKEVKLFFSAINLIATAFLVVMLFDSYWI